MPRHSHILLLILMLMSMQVFPQSNTDQAFPLEEEEYIDDIPFNTPRIFAKSILDQCIEMEQAAFILPDEAGVDDIPFNTGAIAMKVKRCFHLLRLDPRDCLFIPVGPKHQRLAQKNGGDNGSRKGKWRSFQIDPATLFTGSES